MRPCRPADKLHYLRPSPASRQELARAPGLNENPMADCRPETRRQARSSLGVLIIALLLGGCSGGILDPKGPVGSAQRLILFDALAIMLAIVVPVIVATLAFAWWFRASNSKARYLADWAYSGRIELIVWAIPALVIMFLGGIAWIGSHDLDPAQSASIEDKPLEVAGRLARLEMAVHLPGAGRRERQPARRAGRRARAFSADLGQRDERVLRAAARQPDLHDERHDDAAQPAGRSAGRVSRPVRAIQRRRLLRACTSRCARVSSGGLRRVDRRDARAAVRSSMPQLTPCSPSRARTWRPRPIGRSSPDLFNAIVDA